MVHQLTTHALTFSAHLQPEVFVHAAGYHAALKENDNPSQAPLANFKVQVLEPVTELRTLQWLDVKVRPLDTFLKCDSLLHLTSIGGKDCLSLLYDLGAHQSMKFVLLRRKRN